MPSSSPSRRQLLACFGASLSGLAGCETLRSSGPTATPSRSTSTDWPTYQHDSAHTGHAPDARGPTDRPSERWRFETDDRVQSQPVVADGRIFAGDDDGIVYAIESDGTENWRFETDDEYEIRGSPAVADGTVYVGNATLYALDATDGAVQWRSHRVSPIWSPAVVDDTVVVGTNSAGVAALDAADGTERWHVEAGETPFALHAAPAVADGAVFLGSHGYAYALSIDDGTELWRRHLGDAARPLSAAPVAVADTVYVGFGSTLLALDAVDGTERWRSDADSWIRGAPALVGDTLYVGTDDGRLFAIEATTGDERWSASVATGIGVPPVAGDGTVFLADDTDGAVVALEPDGGGRFLGSDHVRWRTKPDVGVETSPAISGNRLLIGGYRGIAVLEP